MPQCKLLSLIIISIAFLSHSLTASEAKIVLQLPEDPNQSIVSLNFEGGLMLAPKQTIPALNIKADGHVIVRNHFDADKPFTMKLSQERLNKLYSTIVNKHQFLELSAEKIRADVKKALNKHNGPIAAIADATSTKISLYTASKTHTINYYAVGFSARQRPDVKSLQQFYAVEQMLNNIRYECIIGGADALTQQIKQVNQQLKSEHPQVDAFKTTHLRSAWKSKDGILNIQFLRTQIKDNTQHHFQAKVLVNKQGTQVKFHQYTSKTRRF